MLKHATPFYEVLVLHCNFDIVREDLLYFGNIWVCNHSVELEWWCVVHQGSRQLSFVEYAAAWVVSSMGGEEVPINMLGSTLLRAITIVC